MLLGGHLNKLDALYNAHSEQMTIKREKDAVRMERKQKREEKTV